MAGGWTRDGVVHEQIDATVEDAIQLARSRLPEGESSKNCEECDALIPDERRNVLEGNLFKLLVENKEMLNDSIPEHFF